MNRKILLKWIIQFAVFITILSTAVGFILAFQAKGQFRDIFIRRYSGQLSQVSEAVRQDLLQGNLRGARRYLEEMVSNGFVVGYKVNPINDMGLGPENKSGTSKIQNLVTLEIPILFSDLGQKWGSVEYFIDLSEINSLLSSIFLIILCSAGSTLLCSGLLLWLFSRRLLNTVQNIYPMIEQMGNGLPIKTIEKHTKRIWAPLTDAIEQNSLRLEQLAIEKEKSQKTEVIAQVATQVAHDIRSPLAALSMAEKDLHALPEETRLMIRSAVGRIKDIANELLKKNREGLKAGSVRESEWVETPAVLLLASLVDSVISEKRMQFRADLNLIIETNLDRGAYGLFVEVNSAAFKRVLSNLVNNAVEAIQSVKQNQGKVTVKAQSLKDPNQVEGKIILTIEDNGPGVPESLISKLGTRGETHGKEGGSGLGLYHAMQTVRELGGTLTIESSHTSGGFLGSGTRIKITLPEAKHPTWFVQKIVLADKAQVVVLDDDDSIHQIWNGRFDSVMAVKLGVKIAHFSAIAALKEWYLENQKNLLTALYLFDYEILSDSRTGLDLIEELGLGSQAILVTSRFEEPEIRNRCERLGVRLIPKGLSGFVPIEVQKSARQGSDGVVAEVKLLEIDCVLIDDDALIHSLWQSQAKKMGKKILGVYSESELTPFLKRLAKNCPIYVDSNLAKQQKGEDVAKRLNALGFETIYLATGYDPSHFGPMPWIKGVVGKEPPWSEN